MADKKPTKEQYAKFKARANDKSISAEARATFQKLVDKFKSEFETAEKEVEKVVEDKPKARRGRKAGTTATKRTTKPKTEQSADDIAKAKADIKKRTGKTEEECESIIEEYKALRTKAQTRRKAETKAKEDNTRRINKLKKEDNIIDGTAEKTADAVIETNTKDIAQKIEKEIEKVEDKAEREETAKAKKEVEKTSPNKSATEKKKEVEKKVEAQVEKKVKAKTKVVVKKVIIDTTAMLSSIAESLGKFDKDSQKEFLMKLRSDIDKLLNKYMYGGDVSGATQQLDITQSNLSSSSVNPYKFAKGGSTYAEGGVVYALVDKFDETKQDYDQLYYKTNDYNEIIGYISDLKNEREYDSDMQLIEVSLNGRMRKFNSSMLSKGGSTYAEGGEAGRFNPMKNSYLLYEGQSILLKTVPSPKERRFLDKEIVIEKIDNNKILEAFVRETGEKVPFFIDSNLFKIEQYADGGNLYSHQIGKYVRAYYNETISNDDNGYQVNLMFYNNEDDDDYFDEEFITTNSPEEAEILADKINEEGYEKFMPKNKFAGGGGIGWNENALEELQEFEGDDEIQITTHSGNLFYASNDNAEYIVFKSYDDAYDYAYQMVNQDLVDNPDYFNQDWLFNFVDIDGAKSFLSAVYYEWNYSYANDIKMESDSKYSNRLISEMVDAGLMDDEDAESEDAESTAISLMDDFVEYLTNSQIDEGRGGLDYYENNFGQEQTMQMIIENNLIDIDEATEGAIDEDGVAHFISSYDGNEIELPSGYYAYRTN